MSEKISLDSSAINYFNLGCSQNSPDSCIHAKYDS